jgi:hypothetical protein
VVDLIRLVGAVERMRAACVGPSAREGRLLERATLQAELAFGVEEEDGEGAVETLAGTDDGVQMAYKQKGEENTSAQ